MEILVNVTYSDCSQPLPRNLPMEAEFQIPCYGLCRDLHKPHE